MGGIVAGGAHLFAGSLAQPEVLRAVALLAICGLGAAAYFALAWQIGGADRAAIAALAERPLDRMRRRRDKR